MDVERLQTLLARDSSIYPEGIVSGNFGQLTQKAVKKFQAKYGISQVGRVGPVTRAKLAEVFGEGQTPVAPATLSSTASLTKELSPGAKGDDVKALQEYLAKDKDIYPEGLVTGYYGPMTTAAVRRFQAKYGISQVGRVGPATLQKLQELMSGVVPAPTQTLAPEPAPTPVPTPAPVPAPAPTPSSSEVPWFLQLTPAPVAQ